MSKKFKKSVDFSLAFCYITYALRKKANKALKKVQKKSKKVVDKTSRKCYIKSTRCKESNARNDL